LFGDACHQVGLREWRQLGDIVEAADVTGLKPPLTPVAEILVGPFPAIPIKRRWASRLNFPFLFDTARLPLAHLPPETIERIGSDREADGADPEADIRVAKHPEDIMLEVVGGAGIKSAYVPT
jgi:hypothetical protein